MDHAGSGLIETMRVREGQVPLLDGHLARLARSLAELGLAAPVEDVGALVRAQADARDAMIRVAVAGGRAWLTVRELPASEPLRLVTAAVPHAPYPHKTTARGVFERAAAEAWTAGADDALLLTTGKLVAEATVWSVFWWEGEALRTPALGLRILPGVARARIGELTPLVEGWWGRDELAGRSVFLANAARGIVPVATLDGEPVPRDRRTSDLAGRFWPR